MGKNRRRLNNFFLREEVVEGLPPKWMNATICVYYVNESILDENNKRETLHGRRKLDASLGRPGRPASFAIFWGRMNAGRRKFKRGVKYLLDKWVSTIFPRNLVLLLNELRQYHSNTKRRNKRNNCYKQKKMVLVEECQWKHSACARWKGSDRFNASGGEAEKGGTQVDEVSFPLLLLLLDIFHSFDALLLAYSRLAPAAPHK